jgi:hypothetical protein
MPERCLRLILNHYVMALGMYWGHRAVRYSHLPPKCHTCYQSTARTTAADPNMSASQGLDLSDYARCRFRWGFGIYIWDM